MATKKRALTAQDKRLKARELEVKQIIKKHINNAPNGAALIDADGYPLLAEMLSKPLKYLKAWKYEDILIKEALHTIYRLSRAYKQLGFDVRWGKFGISAIQKMGLATNISIAEDEVLHWSLRICGAISANIIQENNEREELWEVIYKANGSYGYLSCLAGIKPEEFKKMGQDEQLAKARDIRHEPTRKMRDEANRLYQAGNFKTKNSAKHELKSLMIDFGLRKDVGFTFKAENIEQTIYDWLLYPHGKPKKKK